MLKSLFTLIFFLAVGSLSMIFGQQSQRFEVSLDKTVVNLSCPVSKTPDAECPLGKDRVRIHVEPRALAHISLRYRVSGGRIIGSGKDVVWDLANSRPGVYKLTVKAKEGSRSLPAVTKTIKLEECPECDLGCTCPTLAVVPPRSSVVAGNTVIFASHITGVGQERITYKWTVENGKMIKGSKTGEVTVRALRSGKKLTATVEIGGLDPTCSCQTIASETVDIR
jgi:hypothetical protein